MFSGFVCQFGIFIGARFKYTFNRVSSDFFLSNARRDMNINKPKLHKHAINMKIKESGLLRNKSIEHKTFLVIY